MKWLLTILSLVLWSTSMAQQPDTLAINKYFDQSKTFEYSNKDSALYFATEALNLSRELNNKSKETSSYKRLGDIWSIHEVFDSAIFYYKLALDIHKAKADNKSIAIIMSRIGYSYYYAGQYDNALEYFKKVVDIYLAEDNKPGLAIVYNNLSACYSALDNIEESYNYSLMSLKINEELKDEEGIAGSLVSLGALVNGMGNYNKAIDYYNKAMKHYVDIGSKTGQSMCFNNLGDSYSSLGKYEEALDYFNKALEIDIELEDDYGIAIDENNIADNYLIMGDTAKALSGFRDVLKFAQEKGFRKVISTCCYNLAEIYYNKANYSEAIKYGKISEEYARLTGSPRDIMDACQILSNSYAELGKYGSAYGFLKYYGELYDSLFTAEKSRQILEIEAKYESERKEHENQLLIRQNVVDKRIKIALSGLLVIAIILIFTLYRLIYIKRKSESKLAIQKNFYEKLLGNSQDFIVVVDKNLNIKYVSPSIESKIGRNPEDRVGKNVFENVHPGDKMALQTAFNNILKGSNPLVFEFRLSDASGRYLNMAAYAKKLFDDPNIQGIIVNFWDITEIRRTEQALKMANDTKDKVFSIISHDLRGPISTNKSIIDLVVNEFDNLSKGAIRDLLTSYKPTADATYFLLENLLSWAMDQMGKLKFEPGLNPVKPIIDANINLYSAQAESKAITIINAITENLIAYFDKGMIDIVIRNFISNAVKFTPKGGEIIINTKKEGGFLKVEVSDTGIGIDEDVVNSLFGKGIKSKYLGQGTENEKGAGIGLMLCEEFVELNGGTIGVVSKKNIGSVFFFTLPVE